MSSFFVLCMCVLLLFVVDVCFVFVSFRGLRFRLMGFVRFTSFVYLLFACVCVCLRVFVVACFVVCFRDLLFVSCLLCLFGVACMCLLLFVFACVCLRLIVFVCVCLFVFVFLCVSLCLFVVGWVCPFCVCFVLV